MRSTVYHYQNLTKVGAARIFMQPLGIKHYIMYFKGLGMKFMLFFNDKPITKHLFRAHDLFVRLFTGATNNFSQK